MNGPHLLSVGACAPRVSVSRAHVDAFFGGLAQRTDEVKRRCRRNLRSFTLPLV